MRVSSIGWAAVLACVALFFGVGFCGLASAAVRTPRTVSNVNHLMFLNVLLRGTAGVGHHPGRICSSNSVFNADV